MPADGLFSEVNKAHPHVLRLQLVHHLVQHTGAISARLTVTRRATFRLARSRSFPVEEGWVLLDDDEEW